MKKNLRLSFQKGDILAILEVAVMAVVMLVLFLPGKNAGQDGIVQVWQDGKLKGEYALMSDERIIISGDYRNDILIENGRVCIAESDCPGTDCVHSGWISAPGRSIVCLPNRVEIRITGTSEVDFAVG